MRRFFARLIVALPATFGPAALGHAEILIGLPAPYTGPNAWMGEGIERGAEMAIADLNAAGGILGQPLGSSKSTTIATASRRWPLPTSWSPPALRSSSVINAPALPSQHPKSTPRPAFSC
jgi:Periplasmic binding protein